MENKIEYKWLFLDLDGTIVTKDYVIPEKTIKIINELKNRINISIATGRSCNSAGEFIEKLQIKDTCIFQNGAIIYHPIEKTLEKTSQIPPSFSKVFIKLMEQHALSFKMYTEDDVVYKSKDTPWEGEVINSTEINVAEMDSLIGSGPIKFIIYSNKNEMERFLSETKSQFSTFKDEIRIFQSNHFFWEITNINVSKGNALNILSRRFNVPLEQIIAVGDYDNDLELVSNAGLGICVKDASENLKKVADVQIPGPELSGIEYLFNYIN